MKKLILVFILLFSLNTSAQKRSRSLFRDFVECFYPENETEPIYIYEKPNGKIVKKLTALSEPYCWYKFAISESKDGWLKIENLVVLPACEKSELNENIGRYKGKWILARNMEIDLPDTGTDNISEIDYRFYEKPNISSKVVFTANEFLRPYLIAVHGTWAKVNVVKDGKKYCG